MVGALRRAAALGCRPQRPRFASTLRHAAEGELLVEEMDEGCIVVLSMNRPKAKNALGRVLLRGLAEEVERLRFSPARCLIIQSTVPGVFCAGADLKERATMQQDEVGPFVHKLRSTFSALESLSIPTISSIEGAALGGGLELALSCDFRVMGGGSVGLPETGLAIIPGAGGTQRLPRLVGSMRAKELIFTGRRVSASEAKELGLITEATDEGKGFDKALEIARAICEKGPIAIKMAKAAIDNGMNTDIVTGMQIEQACYAQVIPTEDRLEGLAAFKAKRAPVYKGN